jgi:hypothetical protein
VNPLNDSPLTFPVLGCFHLLGFLLFVGTTAVVDFRLLGLGMRRQAVADLAKNLKPWTFSGLAVVLVSGPLLFTADSEMFYQSRAFQVKMICLVVAIAFHSTVHRKAISAAAPGAGGRIIACVSLVLWTSVIAGGIFMGFA